MGPRVDGALLDCLYEAPFEAKGWQAFLRMLEEALGGDVVMLCMPLPSNDDAGLVVAPSLGVEFVESYRTGCFRTDPWLRDVNALALGEIAGHEGRIGGQALVDTSYGEAATKKLAGK